jgi:transposase
MIPIPAAVRVWLATGRTDMHKGFDGLALIVQETLKRDPHSGHLFVFRGRRGDLIKCLWHDGQGLCRLCQSKFSGCLRPCWPRRMSNPFRYFNSSPEVIRLVVMMYVRYPLSLRNVEDLLEARDRHQP